MKEKVLLTLSGGLPCGNWPDSELVPYIPEKVAQAMVAANVHVAADKAVDWANGDVDRPDDGVWLNVTSVIDTDAHAALSALLKAEREKAAAEVWKAVANLIHVGTPSEGVLMVAEKNALALIEKEQADG